MIVRKVVVLPAPLRPTRQTTSRSPTASETWRRMWLWWVKTPPGESESTALALPSDDGVHHVGIGADPGRGGVGQDSTLVERDDAVRVGEDDVHVRLDMGGRGRPD